MKKVIFSITEKHELIKIRYRRTQKSLFAVCADCGKQFEWLTVEEAADLSGTNAEEIRHNIKTLREQNQTPKKLNFKQPIKENENMKRILNAGVLFLILVSGMQVFAQENVKPAPVFSDLLSNVYLRDNGQLKPLTTYAYFLSGEKGALKVLRNGSEIAEFSFRIEPYTVPKYTIEGYELIKGKNNPLGLILEEAGKYELEYYANGTKFYSFPFELVVGKSDPYKPNKLMQLNGAWNNYAYLHKTNNESHGKWEFRVFVRSDDGSYKQSKGQVLMIREADKKVVAVGSSNFRREAGWTRQTFTLQKPGKKNAQGEYYGNQGFYANREKPEDGSYTLNFNLDGKLYGAYKFTVKDGEIQLQGRQIRASTDPLTFIEGGGREIWLEKQ
jgi:hypothetical protein